MPNQANTSGAVVSSYRIISHKWPLLFSFRTHLRLLFMLHLFRKKNKKKLRKFITSVYQERVPDKPAASSASKGPIFGVPLDVAVQRSRVNDRLPLCRVFQDSIMFIETFGRWRKLTVSPCGNVGVFLIYRSHWSSANNIIGDKYRW